ncbi:MAG TPA: cyanophycin synthetase, partial [Tepidisphaeraceae bacterium]
VFGCGGDRDRSKRPRMARVAQQHADAIYLTSDNPRTEPAQAIITEVMSGFTLENTTSIVLQPDRRAAIRQAIDDARPGDLVLIAGKGHENYQVLGTVKHPFDDVEEARIALSAARA